MNVQIWSKVFGQLARFVDLEAGGVQRVQGFPVAVKVGAAILEQHVGEIVEAALRGDAGLELADGAGGGVARVGENRQAFLFALVVHFLEGGDGHEHFAADFEIGGDAGFLQLVQRDGKRDGANRAHVQGDVFADGAVAAGDAADQFAILVVQGQGHAVELQFADVVNVLASRPLSSWTRRSQLRSSSSL